MVQLPPGATTDAVHLSVPGTSEKLVASASVMLVTFQLLPPWFWKVSVWDAEVVWITGAREGQIEMSNMGSHAHASHRKTGHRRAGVDGESRRTIRVAAGIERDFE